MADLYAQCQKDIQHIQDMLEAQQTALPDADITKAIAIQSGNVMRRLRSIRVMTPEQSGELQSLLLSGPWTDNQKEDMLMVLTVEHAKGEAKTSSPQSQVVEDFVGFLSVQDVQVLSDPAVTHLAKVKVLADRCMAIGVVRPTEVSYKNVLSAGVAAGLVLTPHEKLPYLTELKRLVTSAAKRREKPEPYLCRYPTSAGELPAALQACYEADPAANVEGGSARALSAGLRCRRPRAGAHVESLAIVPATSHAAVPQPSMGPMAGVPRMPMASMMAGMHGMHGMGGKGGMPMAGGCGMPGIDPNHPMFGMFMGMMNYNMQMMMMQNTHGQGDGIKIQMNNSPRPAAPSSPVVPRQLFETGPDDSQPESATDATAPGVAEADAEEAAPKTTEATKTTKAAGEQLSIVEAALIAREKAKAKNQAALEGNSSKQKAKSKPKAKAKGATSKAKAKAKTAAKAKASSSKAKAEAKAASKTCSGIKGKSIYGLARDNFKANFSGDAWEEAWQSSQECQNVLNDEQIRARETPPRSPVQRRVTQESDIAENLPKKCFDHKLS